MPRRNSRGRTQVLKNKNKNLNNSNVVKSLSLSNPQYSPNPLSGWGVRSERLRNDGRTFTLEVPIPRPIFPLGLQNYAITQTTEVRDWFSSSTSSPSFTYAAFYLNLLPQAVTMAALFDQYRVVGLEIRITPQLSAGISASSGLLHSVIDLDDSNNLTAVSDALEYQSCVTSPVHTGHIRTFIPHVSFGVYQSAVSTGYASVPSPWIDAAYRDVQHYGIKVAVTSTSGAGTGIITYDLVIIARIELRAVH